MPSIDKAEAMALAAGVSLAWLVSGEGAMRTAESSGEASARPIDDELMGRVTDALVRTYKELGATISPVDLGRLSARRYNEIVAAAEDPAERLTMVKLVASQLRTELTKAAKEPGTGKRSA